MTQWHKYPTMAQRKGIFYVHKASMTGYHSTFPEKNMPPHLTYITTYITTNIANYEVMDINATSWHRTQVYFRCPYCD